MKKALLFLSFLFYSFKVFALADLVVTQGNFTPTSINKCQNLTVTATIKNTGNVVAPASMSMLTISDNANFTTENLLSRATVKSLAPNESVTIEFIYPIPSTLSAGTYYVAVKVDVYGEVQENNESNNYRLSGTLNLNNLVFQSLKMPYPYIFIHGLVGSSETWDALTDDLDDAFGWTYGGRMDFCLNADNNKFTSNLTTDYKDFTATQNNLIAGDYYYVNFAVESNGIYNSSTTNQSNQSAIVKQGRAVRDAIKYVRQKTGSDKVILVGHSMGGLASREYLQNNTIWQSDGQHHVAKLLTIGTPHGGSNSASLGLNIFDNIDEKSEAVRDLRYPSIVYGGRYLFGGTEAVTIGFNNDDINCNGVVGDVIKGLNEKSIPNNIFYSCIIGTGAVTGGDGVVAADRANLNNYYSIQADTFNDRTFALTETHTELHQNLKNGMKGLDEPYDYSLSYNVSLNKLYFGLITEQSKGSPYNWDYDDFKFSTTTKGNIRLKLYNIPVHDFEIDVVDVNYNKVVPTITSNSRSNIDTIINLNAGTYFLEISGNATSISYFFPYAFRMDFTPTTAINEISEPLKSQIFPNPVSNIATLKFSLLQQSNVVVKIYNSIGQQVKEKDFGELSEGQNQIQIADINLDNGMYIYSILTNSGVESKQFIVQK